MIGPSRGSGSQIGRLIGRRGGLAKTNEVSTRARPEKTIRTGECLAIGETLRESGEDLSSFFYLLENPRGTRHRCAVGHPFNGADEPSLDLDRSRSYY